MPKTRKQNRRRRRKDCRKYCRHGGAPLPTTYSTPLQQFLLDNYPDASLEVIKQFQDAGVSFSDARKYLGNKDIHFTPQQIVSLKNRGWSQMYIDGQNGTVPYELLMAFDPETHVDPQAYSAPNNLDQTVVEMFEAPKNDLSFSNAQIEQLIGLGLNDDKVIEDYEREVAAGKSFEDVIDELRPGTAQMNYQQDDNAILNVRQREDDDSGRNVRQRLNSNGLSSNRSLHVSDLENDSSSNGSYSNGSRLRVSDLVNGSSSNGSSSNGSYNNGSRLRVSQLVNGSSSNGSYNNGSRLRVSQLVNGSSSNGLSSNRSLHVSDLVNGSSSNGSYSNGSYNNGSRLRVSQLVDESDLDGGKRKRKSMRKRVKKRRTMKKR